MSSVVMVVMLVFGGGFCCGGVGDFLIKCFQGGHLLEDQPRRRMSCWPGRQVTKHFTIQLILYFSHLLQLIQLIKPMSPDVVTQAGPIPSPVQTLPISISPRQGAFTGQKIAYIYPDFYSALIGVFVDGVMKEAQEVSQ